MNTDWIKIGTWLFFNQQDILKQILLEKYPVPSLDGQGKMSKSKGGKTVINLTDDKETIEKKIAKIPSNEENFHVFFCLYWYTLKKEDREILGNQISEEVQRYFLK